MNPTHLPTSNNTWFCAQADPPPLHQDFSIFREHIDANLTESLLSSLLCYCTAWILLSETSMSSILCTKNISSSRREPLGQPWRGHTHRTQPHNQPTALLPQPTNRCHPPYVRIHHSILRSSICDISNPRHQKNTVPLQWHRVGPSPSNVWLSWTWKEPHVS